MGANKQKIVRKKAKNRTHPNNIHHIQNLNGHQNIKTKTQLTLELARLRTLVIGLEIIPVSLAASVRELATLLVVHVVVEPLQDGATGSFLSLLQAHLC